MKKTNEDRLRRREETQRRVTALAQDLKRKVLENALTPAERQMLELLRQSKHLTLNISRDGDQWNMRLEDHNSGIVGTGAGPTFDRAWDDIVDPRLRSAAQEQ
jgi:hypothetical protein